MEDKALDEKARLSSLLCLTALPYLWLKLQQKLSLYRLQLADGVLFYEPERKLKQLGSWLGGLMYAGVRWWHVAELASGGCSVPELRMQGLRLGPSHSGAEPGALLQGLAFVAQLGTASGEQDNHPHSPRTVSVPGPPVYHQRAAEHAGRCPLCFRSPVLSPTAVAPSGYVFCFGCIVHHVQGARAARCPVTHLPISLQHLVRIYKTHSS